MNRGKKLLYGSALLTYGFGLLFTYFLHKLVHPPPLLLFFIAFLVSIAFFVLLSVVLSLLGF
jgi:hypothetical protein